MMLAMESVSPYLAGLLAVVLLTSFVKIITTLSIVRFGLGLEGVGFGIVILSLGLALSLMIMSRQSSGDFVMEALLSGRPAADMAKIDRTFRPFLEKQSHKDIKQRFARIAVDLAGGGKDDADGAKGEIAGELPLPVLAAAFLVSELKEAFKLGFLFIIPFVVIDLLVVNVLMALGVTQMPHNVVSLPLKVILFFAVDGWTLISEKLLAGYL